MKFPEDGDAARVALVVRVHLSTQCHLAVTPSPSHRNGTFISLLQGRALSCQSHLLSLQGWRDLGAAAGDPQTHLDQPKSGGAAQEMAMTQVKAMPIMAWLAEKRKLPMGLQMTM